MPVLLNDIHGRLNPTRVRRIVAPSSLQELQRVIRSSGELPISIAGGRHAMGGQQFGEVPRYHDRLTDLPAAAQGSEVISELYVPRDELRRFLRLAADLLRRCRAPVTYGTVRLIRRDNESFLRWANDDYACVIFNLLTPETPSGRERTKHTFRRLYDLALGLNGSFYLTYHNFATKQQVEWAYPQMPEFLARKRDYDPEERFQSSWYRYMKSMFVQSEAAKQVRPHDVGTGMCLEDALRAGRIEAVVRPPQWKHQ